MKKTLLLTIDFPPHTGGVAHYLSALADFYSKEIVVIAHPVFGEKESDQIRKGKVIRQSLFFRFVWPKWSKTLFLLLKNNEYHQILVSHVLPLGTAAYFAKLITKKPYLVIVHGMDIRLAKQFFWKRFLVGLVLRGAKLVITNSIDLQTEVERSFRVKKTVVLYPCLTHINQCLQKIPHKGIRLLTVSRLVARKGHLRVLDALIKLKESQKLKDITYTIIGYGEMKTLLQKKIDAQGLQNSVQIHSSITDEELAQWYAKSDIFIMPVVHDLVDKEGFGLVFLEAALFGLPSITTNMPGVDEAVIDHQTGLLLEDGDISALAQAILNLAQNRELRDQLGTQAADRAKKVFSCEKQFEVLKPYL
ncbi:MAG: Glycosyl transferase group 1 [Candidatus Uhrbacteria bacterium GW2011_GWE2_40_58]|nr:MAG: Glycosyl transferase group 1 [Candidatus Uhrbacteria bacterium GW2011_GWF2_40_263]KKR68092.1 MAG: Glycosyl transferase group 1 [Candidatus Uhrbacteria bacterium GW2011_GWE2_40_58]OGL91793.1 MAG: hypothetical protein A2239_04510 [Candidatus Uhrbacteria bacterium RIFOXYA2_FULL_40_9]OGL97243.1 MAG: hypothetical protein A2332_01485 [Candidatus Uhrbacteria bacterium RIFOXYB2_FULL_41_18]HBK34450.1 hypothetical protein [Candidatus Uhrbacteria bacterium]